MTSPEIRLSPKTRVVTTQQDDSTDWVPGAREKCRWGVLGKIVRVSDAHGLCYEVAHEGGGVACYNPGEIMPIVA